MSIFLNLFDKMKVWGYHQYPRVYTIMCRRKAMVKFVMSGGIAGAVDLISLYICHGLFQINLIISTTIAFILSFWVSFYLQKFWTFSDPSRQALAKQIGLYILIAFINLNLNGYLMHVFVNLFSVHYILSQVIVSLLIGLESFLVYKFLVFRKRCSDKKAELN